MMATVDPFQGLVLKGIKKLDRKELGRGAYGRVYAVDHCGTVCAAKEIHSILVEEVEEFEMRRTVESFMRECQQCSILRHPNVIQFLGVYYPSEVGWTGRVQLPVMVMEMMADSLTSFVNNHKKIPINIKFSIVNDVSLGLCYLHNHDPPIVHRDLSPNNILLTVHHVAKISDLGVAKVVKADSRKTLTKAPGTVDFMPPEALKETPIYGPAMDVFSFAGIVLHTFIQQWPHPSEQVQFDPKSRRKVALMEVERRQQYLERMTGEAQNLRSLVEECLDDDPAVRPTITAVCERIKVSKDVHTREHSQNLITLYQQVEQQNRQLQDKDAEISRLKYVVENLNCQVEKEVSEVERLKQEIVRIKQDRPRLEKEQCNAKHTSKQQERSKILRIKQNTLKAEWLEKEQAYTKHASKQQEASQVSKLRMEAPPLIPALTSDKYCIKWTRLADLPVPLYGLYATVQGMKIYVAGGESPVENALHQVYVYDAITNQWSQLPPSGHYCGIPQVIGGKLAIIGGRLSATKNRTNKVSTFDEATQTWKSHYPDLLVARSRPGVVTFRKHVIVAGRAKGGLMPQLQKDIEILDWEENSNWTKLLLNLPVPMCSFAPSVYNDQLIITGFTTVGMKLSEKVYAIPLAKITETPDTLWVQAKWCTLTPTTHWYTALVSNSSPPVVVGGENETATIPTEDIKMFAMAVATLNNNALVVIGGCTKGDTVDNSLSSSLTTVELGQMERVYC
ncbi:serine/threonine-protein kinase WNK-like isoform X2 [Dysidea avara]|uniref:serine/threonine-protein kinase WNK-like isoform X2 n=1 Tax=Dysidea avara TaxID=196820 RepID=UPI00331E314A